jgi:hypothetical protein
MRTLLSFSACSFGSSFSYVFVLCRFDESATCIACVTRVYKTNKTKEKKNRERREQELGKLQLICRTGKETGYMHGGLPFSALADGLRSNKPAKEIASHGSVISLLLK